MMELEGLEESNSMTTLSRCNYCNTALHVVYKNNVKFYTDTHDTGVDKKPKKSAKYCPFCGKKIGTTPLLSFYDIGTILRHLRTFDTFRYDGGLSTGDNDAV